MTGGPTHQFLDIGKIGVENIKLIQVRVNGSQEQLVTASSDVEIIAKIKISNQNTY